MVKTKWYGNCELDRDRGTQNEVLSLTARCVFVGTASHSKTPLPLAIRAAGKTPFRNSMGFHKRERANKKGQNMAENEKPTKVKKVAKQNRHIKFEFRLTEEELERLKTQSESHASISEYIRKQCLEGGDSPIKMGNQSLKDTLKVLREMNMQLQKIGVNLNQTSKHLNFLVLHNVIDKNMGGRLGHNYSQVERLLWLTDRSLRELIKKF